MSAKRLSALVLVAALVMLAVGAGPQVCGNAPPAAQAPDPNAVTLPYSGTLSDDAGQPVPDGAYTFVFTLYPAETGGEPLWTETQGGVTVKGGVFVALLGSRNAIPKGTLDGGDRWLEVAVRGPGEAEFTVLTPRQRASAASSATSPGVASTQACPHNHWGETWSGSGNGLVLYGNSDNYATLYASDNSPNGGFGLYGRSEKGVGVYGRATGTAGKGVYGHATANSGTSYGVYGETRSPSGYGMYGTAPNYGVAGRSTVTLTTEVACGVCGYATAVAGRAYGVFGTSSAIEGGAGVVGMGQTGVAGFSGNGYGAIGSTTNGVGVYAVADGNGDALVASGKGSGNLIEAWYQSVPANRRFYVSNVGEVYADGNFHAGGADLAEMLPAVEELEPGDVLVIGPDGRLARSSVAYQPTVVGIYSSNPGFIGGSSDDADLTGKIPLAIVGVVPVKASAENGPIRPGDLLVASSTPGHAMKAGANPSVGTVIGKALQGLGSGTGVIRMLVMLQ